MAKPTQRPRDLSAFISSTFIDLRPYREKVEESLSRIETTFSSMRYFGSREGDPLTQCLEKLRGCNYYISIIGYRYGTVHDELKLSITELEYEEAKKLGISRAVYMADDTVLIKSADIESDEKRKLLDAFKQKLKKENTVVLFESPADLAGKVVCDILGSHSKKDDFTSFAKTKYRPAIHRTCSLISFLGLDIQTMKRHKDVKLAQVYVHSAFLPAGGRSELRSTQLGLLEDSVVFGTSRAEQAPLSLSEMLCNSDMIVVLGDPGSGKSTLTKYLILGLVDGLPEIGAGTKRTIPIRVPLRAYAEYRQRAGGVGITILDFIRDSARTELQLDSLPDGFFDFFLERRDALVIFDGLDEIFDSNLREQVRNDIVSFAQGSFPGNKVFITSRIVGYEEAGFQQSEFAHFEILPFDNKQITEYIEKWYRLEESDRKKREAEVSALEKARENLPQQLLSNPLLLSLIVILFRAGCTLPESKLEIYKSCIGTLTEKWDAAGKRLELPEIYNLVRDKKSAFAHVAYWMYRRLSEETEGQSRPKYTEVRGELGRYLSDREFKGRELEVDKAAENFLEYAAKRSIFVEDRFSHKTFHEYFAALHLFRNFCVGRTADDLYKEVGPYLSSDYWAVVIELLLLMIDEQGAVLLNTFLSKVMADVEAAPEKHHGNILVPLRTLAQLQNIGRETVDSLFRSATQIIALAEPNDPWGAEPSKEGPHHKVFGALQKVPAKYHPQLKDAFRLLAGEATERNRLFAIAAFCYEFDRGRYFRPEEIILSWDRASGVLAKLSLSTFYLLYSSNSVSEQLSMFIQAFGEDKLFELSRLVFQTGYRYLPLAEFSLRRLMASEDVRSYDQACENILDNPSSETILQGLITRSIQNDLRVEKPANLPLEHLSKEWQDRRKYLVDWLLLIRILLELRRGTQSRRDLIASLRGMSSQPSQPQKFYADLLLGTFPTSISDEALGLTRPTRDALFFLLRKHPSLRKRRQAGRRSPSEER